MLLEKMAKKHERREHQGYGRKVLTIYLTVVLLFSLFYYFLCLLSRGSMFTSIFFGDMSDTFADFFKCVYGWCGNPYDDGFCNYPAFAVMMFKFCHHFISPNIQIEDGLSYRALNQIWIVFILYNIFCVWLVSISLSAKLQMDKLNSSLLSIVLLISFPVMFSLERGNQINLAFAATVVFACFYNNKNKMLREISYICLAIAGVLKLYPAIFGLILLKKKKWKEAFRVVIYGVLLFFLPFIYYGKNSLVVFIRSLLSFEQANEERFAYNFSLRNIIYFFIKVIGIEVNDIVINIVFITIIMLVFCAFWLTKLEWGTMLNVVLLMIWIPSISDAYLMLFMIIPFAFFVDDLADDKCKDMNILNLLGYMILFGLLFIPLGLPVIERYTYTPNYLMTYSYVVYFFDIVVLGIYFSVNQIRGNIINKKNDTVENSKNH